MTTPPGAAPDGALSPLRHPAFRWLWIATIAANTGLWMQALGAQWYLVSRPGGGALVALVSLALTLPMALLALPAGILADAIDRRRMLIWVQAGSAAVAALLCVLMATGSLAPSTLIILTALLGCGSALTLTPWQSLIPDLVPRERLLSAAALVGISFNIARVIGPAVAGFVVAWAGIAIVFALNAVLVGVFLVALVAWKGTGKGPHQPERLWPAMRSGFRYVRHSPQVLKLMLRSFWFTLPMMAILALLPLIATERLGMGSSGYGLLFACQGAGAVIGGLGLARARRHFTTNAITGTTVALASVITLALPFVGMPLIAMALMVVAGGCWTMTHAANAGALQVYLPAWVRARGLAIYSMALFGGQAVGSAFVGWMSDQFSLVFAFVVCAVLMAAGATLAWWLPLKQLDGIDRTPIRNWLEPDLVVDPTQGDGQVLVSITYWIDPQHEAEFIRRMSQLRRVRLRTGAIDWSLLKDGEVERRFVEEFVVGSWDEHRSQHEVRFVASDRQAEQAVDTLSNPAPEVRHLFTVDVPRQFR